MDLQIQRKSFEIQTDHCVDQDFIKFNIKPVKGTTTLAFKTKDGILVAVDSRATAGNYIATQSINKVIEINPYLLGTMAGGAADCLYWEKLLAVRVKAYELENDKRMSVSMASRILSNFLYQYKNRGLSMGTMICGWDENGAGLYYVDNDATRIEGNIFSVGSGSTIAYGILQNGYSFDISKEEAIELGRRAIFHAGHRDAFSGGVVRVYFISKEGWEKIGDYDFKDLQEIYVNH